MRAGALRRTPWAGAAAAAARVVTPQRVNVAAGWAMRSAAVGSRGRAGDGSLLLSWTSRAAATAPSCDGSAAEAHRRPCCSLLRPRGWGGGGGGLRVVAAPLSAEASEEAVERGEAWSHGA